MTASPSIQTMLRTRLHAAEWALFFEVRNGTGYQDRTRTADAVAMSLWPSRGLELHGFEFKVSRSDWLRELKEPAKAEELGRFCDRWWLVVSDAAIVQPGELPVAWGLMVPRGNKLVVSKDAPKRKAQPVNRVFLASLLRNAQTYAPGVKDLEASVRADRDALHLKHQAALTAAREEHRRQLDDVRDSIRVFEEASGVRLAEWNARKIGEAVKFVLDGGLENSRADLQSVRETAQRIIVSIDQLEAASPAVALVRT